jgi:hypothetical protein
VSTGAGREQILLLAVLRFLGLNPPQELTGAPCDAILQWGIIHFTALQLPVKGGTIAI